MAVQKQYVDKKFGKCLLETQAEKKGMSLTGRWTERTLRLFDSDGGGLVLAYYKTNKDTKPKGFVKIKPNGKVHEVDHLGKHKNKRENVLTIAALDGRDFTCSLPDPDTRTQWAEVIREETDNASDQKGRRLSQTTSKMTAENIANLTIKVVSHMRYKSSAKIQRKGSVRNALKEVTYGFDFGAFNFGTGKWYKLWTKTLNDKEWHQTHEQFRKSGLLNIFGSNSVALKYPESYGRKNDSLEKKVTDRAFDIELCLHAVFNLVDVNAIRANAAPWVCAIAMP